MIKKYVYCGQSLVAELPFKPYNFFHISLFVHCLNMFVIDS